MCAHLFRLSRLQWPQSWMGPPELHPCIKRDPTEFQKVCTKGTSLGLAIYTVSDTFKTLGAITQYGPLGDCRHRTKQTSKNLCM